MARSHRETSDTSRPWRSRTMSNVTSSQASEDGRSRSGSQDGEVRSGPGVVRASRFPARVSRGVRKMRDTSGLSGINLSVSAVLQSSLENRLRARMDVNGSQEYVLTWKRWDMLSGAPICALRARGRRTSGSGCSGVQKEEVQNVAIHEQRAGMQAPVEVQGSPPLRDAQGAEESGTVLLHLRKMRDKRTPDERREGAKLRAVDGRANQQGDYRAAGDTVVGWPTLTARDMRTMKGGRDIPRQNTGHSLLHTLLLVGYDEGYLNPAFASWLMGFTLDHLRCAPSETPSYRSSRRSSLRRLFKRKNRLQTRRKR